MSSVQQQQGKEVFPLKDKRDLEAQFEIINPPEEREPRKEITFSQENLDKKNTPSKQIAILSSSASQKEKEVNNQEDKKEENDINDGNFITLMDQEDPLVKEANQKNNNLTFNTNFLQKVMMYDYLKLLLKCYKAIKQHKVLQLKHIPYLSKEQSIDTIYGEFYDRFSQVINQSTKEKKKVSHWKMVYIIFSIFKWPILSQLLFMAIFNGVKIFYSSCIIFLLNALEDHEDNSTVYMWAAILCAIQFIAISVGHNMMRFYLNFFPSFRACFMRMLYQKINTLSSFAVKQANVGKLVNLVSNDLNLLEIKSFFIVNILIIPFVLIATAIILYTRLDAYSLIGFAYLLAYIPFQIFQAKFSQKFFIMKAQLADQRIKFTNEVIEGIRLIKMYAWEEAFIQFVVAIRTLEVGKILIIQLIFIFQLSMTSVSHMLACFISFISTYNLGDSSVLTVPKMLSILDLFTFTKLQTITQAIYGATGCFELSVIFDRMITVLTIEESQMKNVTNNQGDILIEDKTLPLGKVNMFNFNAYWKSDKPVLENICLDIKPGQLIGIVGRVVSGKSSLLNCILQEIPLFSGRFSFNGKVAYVEQEPYIFSSSVKENIIFGSELDETFYQQVLQGCCLFDDIKLFDHGDKTQIGERGINLSGGQKARISLARAVYSKSDIVLLDDPISAVDAKVAKLLMEEAILKLLKGKTVLLVTHQVHFTQKADRIIMLKEGRIHAEGTYQELEDQLNEISVNSELDKSKHDEDQKERQNKNIDQNDDEKSNDQENNESEEPQRAQNDKNEKLENNLVKKSEKLFTKEQDENMKVELSTYIKYLGTSSLRWLIPIMIALFVTCEVVFVFYTSTISNYNENDNDLDSRIKLLGYLALVYFINSLLRYLSLTLIIYSANYNIHNRMIYSLVKASVLFFDTTPSGRILNKFSSDLGQIDQELSKSMQDALEIFSNFLILIITIFIINPYFIIVVVFEIFFIRWFVIFVKSPLLQSKQLDLRNRSPIFTCFNQTISGVLPIRTYRKEGVFMRNFNLLLENSLRSTMASSINQKAFALYIHFAATFYCCVGIFMILSINGDPAKLGQAIIFLIQISDNIQWGLRQVINTDVFMSSALRVLNLIEIKSEPDFRTISDEQFIKSNTSSSVTSKKTQKKSENNVYSFPLHGEIEFSNVRMKYREELQHVLNGLTFKINPGEKVGFIGRTGAGKSSIVQALYRLNEIEVNSEKFGKGFIKIDGHDTKQLGIHTIRSGISIIPQVPFIFSGTIRRNLDPLNLYDDEKIISILEDINLKEKVLKLEKGLLTDMTNVSEVFSSGEKQLICLGRAILRQSKLIVLDEATANCDSLTDQIIQQKVRERFAESTVITIAHRLNTIADYDRIIVMEKGSVIEEGIPFELLTQEESVFKQMVAQTGKKNSSNILQIAKSAYKRQ